MFTISIINSREMRLEENKSNSIRCGIDRQRSKHWEIWKVQVYEIKCWIQLLELVGHNDADFAGDVDDWKSTSGHHYFFI